MLPLPRSCPRENPVRRIRNALPRPVLLARGSVPSSSSSRGLVHALKIGQASIHNVYLLSVPLQRGLLFSRLSCEKGVESGTIRDGDPVHVIVAGLSDNDAPDRVHTCHHQDCGQHRESPKYGVAWVALTRPDAHPGGHSNEPENGAHNDPNDASPQGFVVDGYLVLDENEEDEKVVAPAGSRFR